MCSSVHWSFIALEALLLVGTVPDYICHPTTLRLYIFTQHIIFLPPPHQYRTQIQVWQMKPSKYNINNISSAVIGILVERYDKM